MTESPPPQDAHTGTHVGRRGILVAGGVAAVAGAAGGVLAGRSATHSTPDPVVARVSEQLAAARLAEQRLIAGVDVALRSARGGRRALLRQVRAGHVAHLQAIEGAIAHDGHPAGVSVAASGSSASGSASSAPTVRPAAGDVVTAERRASSAAAARALTMSGDEAVLLATIAAAEATHAELLGGRS